MVKQDLIGSGIERPNKCSGIAIKLVRIEFMDFQSNRLHDIPLFTKHNDVWEPSILQS